MMPCALQDVDKATSSRFALEKKLEQLEVEIEFLKRLHQQVGQHVCAGEKKSGFFMLVWFLNFSLLFRKLMSC